MWRFQDFKSFLIKEFKIWFKNSIDLEKVLRVLEDALNPKLILIE